MNRPIFCFLFLPLLLSLSGCFDTDVKHLGSGDADLTPTNTVTASSFQFSYAFFNPTATAPLNQVVFLQGADNSSSIVLSACGLLGTSCQCVFKTGTGAAIYTTVAADMSYDSTGNNLHCQVPSGDVSVLNTVANNPQVYVTTTNGQIISNTLGISTSLTAAQVLGNTLSVNNVRGIYRYGCQFNYLAKVGTTTSSFDCSLQGSSNVPNLEFLTATYHFYLYGSNNGNDNNFSAKASDQLYNAGSSGLICNMQVEQFECNNTNVTPSDALVLDFGLYNTSAGVFNTPISLTPGPNQSTTNYGFAAAMTTVAGVSTCPPGLIPKVFYTTTPAPGDFPASNMPLTLVDTLAGDVSGLPAGYTSMQVTELVGATTPSLTGYCNGTLCVAPTVGPSNIGPPFLYTSTGQTSFCVLPAADVP